MNKPHLETWYKGEFIRSMQAKGKLPRMVTEASERHDSAYNETVDRIFPGPGGIDTVMKCMIKESTKRIDKATKGTSAATKTGGGATQPSTSGQTLDVTTKSAEALAEKRKARKEMKEALMRLESELQQERSTRQTIEAQIQTLKSTGGSEHGSGPLR
eukprot:CAMPEP_0202902784 /NCGR_PEP_ID=MMETSP1392-20130828/17048_1 /ASSEMBLY_ACC=CAM_ASM_000868 /TAXON_ID=225041 /ORGANISM="Chlamydomonas chlamydogama, Strain SAG 11-48b" /LENGTH=157 /DNA_ID=CAMNT_0049589591 /DNA_START=112 /DNA_END=585 /DNA_ORIENTATION=-